MARQRAWGSGSIYKRGKFYYLFTRVNGKAKMLSLRTENREEAERKANEILPDSLQAAKSKEQVAVHIAEARSFIKTASFRLPLDEVWRIYEGNPSRPQSSPGTLGNYKRMWKKFADWLPSHHPEVKYLANVMPEIASEYARELGEEDISANTYNYHIGALKLICRVLMAKAGLEVNPFTGIERRSGVKQQRKEFSLAEVRAILANFDHFLDYPERPLLVIMNHDEMRVLFYLLAFSGLRLADACLLEWKSIAKGMITVTPQKTRNVASSRQVHIPVCPELQRELDDAREWRSEQSYVLPQTADRYKRNPDGIMNDSIRIIEWNGFKERNRKEKGYDQETKTERGRNRRLYGVHSFRHFFASHCALAGVPVAALADILGDNISTLQRYYIHAGDATRKQVLAALPSQPRLLDASELAALRKQAKKLIVNADAQSLMAAIKTLELPKITS